MRVDEELGRSRLLRRRWSLVGTGMSRDHVASVCFIALFFLFLGVFVLLYDGALASTWTFFPFSFLSFWSDTDVAATSLKLSPFS